GFIPDWHSVEKILDADGRMSGLRFNQSTLIEASLVGVPANQDALAKGPDPRPADELIQHVLATWARSPEGRVISREQFDRLYAVVGRSRTASIEGAVKQKRLQRAREVELRRRRQS